MQSKTEARTTQTRAQTQLDKQADDLLQQAPIGKAEDKEVEA